MTKRSVLVWSYTPSILYDRSRCSTQALSETRRSNGRRVLTGYFTNMIRIILIEKKISWWYTSWNRPRTFPEDFKFCTCYRDQTCPRSKTDLMNPQSREKYSYDRYYPWCQRRDRPHITKPFSILWCWSGKIVFWLYGYLIWKIW